MFYYWIHKLVFIFIRTFNSWKIVGKENLPSSGPVVLVANHVSLWDPPVLACSIKRPVCFMAKEELFKIPVLGKIIDLLNAFPVKRGKMDRNALRLAAKCLDNGGVLGLFPEGTRSKTDELLPLQAGSALFALRSGSPLVPVGLTGTRTSFPLTWRGKIQVRIGKPLVYNELYGKKINEADLQRVTEDIRQELTKLCQQSKKVAQ